jgi:uncharacterized membrane protein
LSRVDNAIDIKAPREKIFEYVADIEAQPEWVKWAKDVERTSTTAKGVGVTDRMVMQVGPRKERVEGMITDFKDGQLYVRRLTKGMDLTEKVSLVNVSGGTRVAWILEYRPPMGALGKFMDFLFMSRLMDQLMKDSLTNLKERMESK